MTFPNAHALREAVRAVGLGSIVLETDCPYLAPVPMRGKRNEPAFLTLRRRQTGRRPRNDVGEIATATNNNAKALFSLLYSLSTVSRWTNGLRRARAPRRRWRNRSSHSPQSSVSG